MATNISKITPEELIGKGVTGLPDAPELSTLAMQQKFDELSIDIIIPHINGMADEIDAAVDAEIERAEAAELAISTLLYSLGLSVVDGKLCMTYNT